MRIEDLDTGRCHPQATRNILSTLETHGLLWDGELIYQCRRNEYYSTVLEALITDGRVFRCTCSRRSLSDHAAYPGTCRANRAIPGDASRKAEYALRLEVEDVNLGFQDSIQGRFSQRLSLEPGDFILRRRDGLFAYQLAVVADDRAQSITHIMRGSDLLDNTPRQLYLMHQLNWPSPRYSHLPVLVDRHRKKLSKQSFATPINSEMPAHNLLLCLELLGQTPPQQALAGATPEEILSWASQAWTPARIPPVLSNFTGL